MENVIRGIIEKIPRGVAFDSHYVIETLIKDYSDDYLRFATGRSPEEPVTATMHGAIAQIIFSCNLVRQLPQQSISYNIHGNPSQCALWQKR